MPNYEDQNCGQDSDDLAALLLDALSGSDARRIQLLTALCLIRLDSDRQHDLDRLRRDGPPLVRPL